MGAGEPHLWDSWSFSGRVMVGMAELLFCVGVIDAGNLGVGRWLVSRVYLHGYDGYLVIALFYGCSTQVFRSTVDRMDEASRDRVQPGGAGDADARYTTTAVQEQNGGTLSISGSHLLS